MRNQEKEQDEMEVFKLVLEEFTQEQKTINQTVAELSSAINLITIKVDDLKTELESSKAVPVMTDIKPIQQIMQKGLTDIKLMICSQPKNIVRKFQVLLFPEQDARLFYKVVFSRWFLWLTIMLFLTNLYKWGIHYSDNQKEIKMEQVKNDRIRKAWNQMYNNGSKDVKWMMEKAYVNEQEASQ